MSEKTTAPSVPSNTGKTVQKKKKSSNNLKVKPLEQLENEKVNNEKVQKNQVNKENNDNNKPEIEKKEVDKKKNRYYKKKSMSDMKKTENKSENLSDAKSDVTSSTNEKPDLKKSASKQFLSQKKKRKSKMNLKAEKQEDTKEEDNSDIKLIESFLTSLSMKRDEMEKKEEELINNPPPPQQHTANKFPKKQNYNYTKAYKPKKEIPIYDGNANILKQNEEIKRVLDCFDFPTAYKTHNLMEMFKEYEGNFRINWINDSRALFIFNSEENAKSAYELKKNETEYKIKPYENPTSEFSPLNDESESVNTSEDEKNENENEIENEKVYENNDQYERNERYHNHSKSDQHECPLNHSKNEKSEYQTKYNKYSQPSQPRQPNIQTTPFLRQTSQETQEKPVRRQRPVTSDVVARRLISSALGIKPKEKTEEEKEIDRKKFEEARAKRQAARLERQKRLQENSDIFNE
ncbi:hypothetical protein BCR36DRAFT_375431 [Piromyces finnis]|uniref:Thc1 RRM domain-containing protein n=1 Tax=Piromyces finnis TaxID=1754191 RepID=A0A1Y1UQV9_9FUNG|nr:hypothetical protein BCR36DRAFT_375431 [Piromyces finnis]|eukprot:ORX40431.1 hypothetical protein BCR36DRAFT_375431 [Piromyces finnis]